MVSWAIIFLVLSIIAGVFGFTGVGGPGTWVGQLLFLVFLIAFVISVVYRRRPPTV